MILREITAEQADERLDLFLASQLPELSRSQIQKLIKQEKVTVNGKSASVHRFLKTGDWVETLAETPTLAPKPRSKVAIRNPGLKLPPLNIIDETEDYLVINKPTGFLVHPDARTPHGTLIDLLLAHDPKIAKIGGEPDRPGIVHRLDREVGGLMVVAKTQKAFDDLSQQFAQHSTEKTYLALVHGAPIKDEDDIKFRIARSTTLARMAARPVDQKEGRAAWTHFSVKQRFTGAALLEVRIFSGRTHQIRAHLHAIGHSIMGDTLYPPKRPERNLTIPRLMLQSIGLVFTDPTTGERKEYHLPPDPVFAEVTSTFK